MDEVMIITLEQQAAIYNILTSDDKYHFLQGAAGVGKSYTTLSLIDKAQQLNQFVITTATSHAARANLKTKNHTEYNNGLKDFHPITIQSFLKILPGLQNSAAQSKDDMTLSTVIKKKVEIDETADLLIIDEVSMMGKRMYDRLKYNDKNFKKIVFIGDMNQLPPVLDEAVDWEKICVVHRLTKVLRTANEEITNLANAFLIGEQPDVSHLEVDLDHFRNNTDASKIILAFKNKKVDKYINSCEVTYQPGVPCISHQSIKYGIVGGGEIDVLFNGEPFILGRATYYDYDEVQAFADSLDVEGLYLRNPKNDNELFERVKLFKLEHDPELPFIYLFNGTKEEYQEREWFFAKQFIDTRDRLFKKYKLNVPNKPSMVTKLVLTHFNPEERREFNAVWSKWLNFTKTVLYARPSVASTVHKFQGLGVNDVYLNPKGMTPKMLYTAITRARNKIYFLKD